MRLKYIDDFRDPATAKALVERIRGDAGNAPVRLMEVCGTHTVAIARSGIRPLLSGAVTMLYGPGCPVCVTPDGYIDAAISLGRDRRVLLASFGDMLRVPGRSSSLEKEKGNALEVRIVYSPLDAVTLAAAIGGAIKTAAVRRVGNFSVLQSLRTIPGAMEVLASDPDVRIEGFLCPAHVSVVIGTDAYPPLSETHTIPLL